MSFLRNITHITRLYLLITWHWGTLALPILQLKSNKYYILWGYVCSLRYTACNEHAPYCHLWPVRLYNIFRPYKALGFGKKLLNIKCVFWWFTQILSDTFLILKICEQDIIINMHSSLCKLPFIPVRFYCNLNFLKRFSKNSQISNFMKIRPVGAELFHADRQTHRQTDRQKGTQTNEEGDIGTVRQVWQS